MKKLIVMLAIGLMTLGAFGTKAEAGHYSYCYPSYYSYHVHYPGCGHYGYSHHVHYYGCGHWGWGHHTHYHGCGHYGW